MRPGSTRKKRYNLLLAAFFFSKCLSAYGQSAAGSYQGLYAEPGISPDGTMIAFVSGYDIWEVPASGGQAHLLIANEADDSRPLYSPDGNYLAFTSTRTGRGDIYVFGLKTGSLRRLTYADSYEEVSGWSPDGKYLYFHTSGTDISSMNDVFRVLTDGGTPMPVTADRYASEFFAAPSPDNNLLAFSAKGIASRQWWRKGSSHLDQAEIWLYKLSANDNGPGSYEKLTEHGSRDVWPLWSANGQELFFISDRNGTQNIWSKKITGGSAQALTSFSDGRVLWPSIDKKGTTIVFERDMGIWKYDVNTKKTSQVPIGLSGMNTGPVIQHLKESSGFSDLTISADGKKIAFISHGHIFVTGNQGGESFAVTKGNTIESSPDWNPAGNVLVYNSWRNGKFLLYQYDFTSLKETPLTKDGDDDAASFSPDGSGLAYIRNGKELRLINTKTGVDKLLYEGYFGNNAFSRSNSISWSPDSKWIAFFSHGAKSLRNVSVISITGGPAIPVTFLANSSGNNLSWTADGKSIVFTTGQRTEETKVARVDLIPITATYKEDEFMGLFKERSTTASRSEGGAAGTTSKPDSVYIDARGISQRMNLLPLGVSVNSVSVSNDGKTLLLSASVAGQQHLFTYPVNPVRGNAVLKQLTTTPGMKTGARFSTDDKTVYYLDQGRIAAVAVDSRISRNINTTAEIDIDFSTEKYLVLDQAWKALQDGFYDPNFHKTDWKSVLEKYQKYLPLVKNSSELYRLMNLMIGELNASHSGASAGGGAMNEASTAHAGLRFDRTAYETEGKFKITEIITGGPADISGKIKVGDFITVVNGIVLDKSSNLDQLLDNKIGTKLTLTLAGPGKTGTTVLALSPINTSAEKQLLYRQWVQEQRAYVEKMSGGKLGYVHMFDMSAGSLDQLYIDLDAANINKQGIVIDVRNNNGGFVNAYAIDVFARKGYMTMTSRGLPPAPARTQLGQRAFGAPTILVTNQHSLSDAEDFTEGYRTLQLGKVVGEPTAGWIIYTSSVRLIDGSSIRMPFSRITDHEGKDMELMPRQVDIRVDRPIGESYSPNSSQLNAAVKELLKQISQ